MRAAEPKGPLGPRHVDPGFSRHHNPAMERRDAVPEPSDFRVACELEVRFRDLDAMGHVNNAVYATYFEIARTAYVHALGLDSGGEVELADRFPFIMLDLYCRFLSAATLNDRLRAHVRTSKVGRTSFRFEYLITSLTDGRAIAVGHSTQVYYDYRAGRSREVPPELRAAIETLEVVG